MLADFMAPEQRLVSVALGGIHAKQHQPSGFAVNAVNRNQAVQAELVFQPHQQGFLHIAARGRNGQEMRLVGDD